MVYAVVFYFWGVKFHQNMENINFTPQMEYLVTIFSLFFSGKNVKFWGEIFFVFWAPHLDSDFYLVAFFLTSFF
jgi:hypothetical protein